MAKKEKPIEEQNWYSLGQLRDYIERMGKEKVVSFDGITLTTNKFIYGLGPDGLSKKKVASSQKKK